MTMDAMPRIILYDIPDLIDLGEIYRKEPYQPPSLHAQVAFQNHDFEWVDP